MGKIALVWQADDVREAIAQKIGVDSFDVFLSDVEAFGDIAICVG